MVRDFRKVLHGRMLIKIKIKRKKTRFSKVNTIGRGILKPDSGKGKL